MSTIEKAAQWLGEKRGQQAADEPVLKIKDKVSDLILSPDGERSRTSEEFRVIKRPLLVNTFNRDAADGKQGNLIMVSSSVKGEGKTFTSLNLAMSIAMDLDSTVLLVDADVAEPGLSKALGVKDKPGLIEHLDDQQRDLSRLLLRTDIPNLTILPAGRRHKRSTELLAGRAMKRLVHELANRYPNRIVLFDSPSLLQTSEASVLASLMGQVLIVVEYEMTSQVIVKEALSQFENVDNVYLILNKCKDNIFLEDTAMGPPGRARSLSHSRAQREGSRGRGRFFARARRRHERWLRPGGR
jgi:receptor protein-tyrosine kinase